MLFTVTLVSLCVHIYSYDYMNSDPHLPRFMSYLSLFTGFMLVLVSADNMLQMLVGWEGFLYKIALMVKSIYNLFLSSLYIYIKATLV
jgi:NADH:ubiquinone oxidoreductase subunit 5 (subunit L)/multisubunit Na+/H+ antiporter MnhA subunit